MRVIRVSDPAKTAASLRAGSRPAAADLKKVRTILDCVMRRGDAALFEYTQKFDCVNLGSLRVTRSEIRKAVAGTSRKELAALKEMKRRLERAEKALLDRLRNVRTSFKGMTLRRLIKPIESVGCYIPGGKARYPSTLVMCAVPARVAGVKRIIACTPPLKDGKVDALTLAAADLCGVYEIYKVGGPQAVAAMAYGTKTIRRVDKIVGPGGSFVTIAKLLVSDTRAIDMLAGPTEILILADDSADARLVALDLIAQAEHGPDSFCGLVTCSRELAQRVTALLPHLISETPRREMVGASLARNGYVALCRNYDAAVAFADELAPEHLEILTRKPARIAERIGSAGLILSGKYAAAAASDYCLGSNHVLPTLAFARARGSLSCLDFVKLITEISGSRTGLRHTLPAVEALSRAEGLPGHYNAVECRMSAHTRILSPQDTKQNSISYKHEIRISKSETNPKREIRDQCDASPT